MRSFRAILVALLLLPVVASAEQEGRIVRQTTGANAGHRYRLGEQLGAGSFSIAHRAVDLDTGAVVAVKIQRNEHVLAGHPSTYALEADVLGRAHSSALMEVHGLGKLEGDGRDALVMPLLDGKALWNPPTHPDSIAKAAPPKRASLMTRTLRKLNLARKPVPPPSRVLWTPQKAVRIALRIAQGLKALHAVGVRHNDLHAGNVVIRDEDPETTRLIDVGLSQHDDSAYFEVNDLSRAVGILVKLYSGYSDSEVRYHVVPTPDYTVVRDGRTLHLRDVIEKAFDPYPNRRYLTADELIADLAPFVS